MYVLVCNIMLSSVMACACIYKYILYIYISYTVCYVILYYVLLRSDMAVALCSAMLCVALCSWPCTNVLYWSIYPNLMLGQVMVCMRKHAYVNNVPSGTLAMAILDDQRVLVHGDAWWNMVKRGGWFWNAAFASSCLFKASCLQCLKKTMAAFRRKMGSKWRQNHMSYHILDVKTKM